MNKLWSIGEALIDFLPKADEFIPVVGGAPANVAAAYAKLGGQSFFIGKTSSDMFGDKIEYELKKAQVNTKYLIKTNQANTGLCFVTLKPDGERAFMLYRKNTADMFLQIDEVEDIYFEKNDILQFGSVDLIDMPVKKATDYLIQKIKKVGGILCFDPNVRKNTWDNLDDYKKTIKKYLKISDIIKISDEDCEFIFEGHDLQSIIKELKKTAKLILFTKGKRGSSLYSDGIILHQKAIEIDCKDTTGAGDTFLAAFLKYAILFEKSTYKTALKKAAAASALVCAKKGVMSALPSESQLNDFLNSME